MRLYLKSERGTTQPLSIRFKKKRTFLDAVSLGCSLRPGLDGVPDRRSQRSAQGDATRPDPPLVVRLPEGVHGDARADGQALHILHKHVAQRHRHLLTLEAIELRQEKPDCLALSALGNVGKVTDRVRSRRREAPFLVIPPDVPETPAALARAPVLAAHELVVDLRSRVVGAESLVVEVKLTSSAR